MTLVGGVGTIVGPVIGALLIIVLQNELSDKVGPWVTVIMGVIFITCVLAFRRGIVGRSRALAPEGGGGLPIHTVESPTHSNHPTLMKVLVPVKRVVDYNVKVRVKADGTGVKPPTSRCR